MNLNDQPEAQTDGLDLPRALIEVSGQVQEPEEQQQADRADGTRINET